MRKKRPRPSGYEAEGFLCGPGDRPSRKKPSAKDAAEEWVRPDASRERMQNEIAAAKPRALTTKAQSGQEAAAAAAKQRLVASAPPRMRRQAEMDVERAVNGTLAAKAMRQSSEPEDSWDPPSGKVLVDRAELERLQRRDKLPPICAERAEDWSDEAVRAQTGLPSVAALKAHTALFNSYYPQGIAPLYRGLESVAPQVEAAVRAKVEAESGKAPAAALDWYDKAAGEEEWRSRGPQPGSRGRGKGTHAPKGRGRKAGAAQKPPAQTPAKASGGSKASGGKAKRGAAKAAPRGAPGDKERRKLLYYVLLGALPAIGDDPPCCSEEETFDSVLATDIFEDRDELPRLVAQLRTAGLLLPGMPGEPIGLADRIGHDSDEDSDEDSHARGRARGRGSGARAAPAESSSDDDAFDDFAEEEARDERRRARRSGGSAGGAPKRARTGSADSGGGHSWDSDTFADVGEPAATKGRSKATKEEDEEAIAICDVSGIDLFFGDWFHKRGEDYDVCAAEHAKLSPVDRRAYIKVTRLQDLGEDIKFVQHLLEEGRSKTDRGLVGWRRSPLFSSDIDDVRMTCSSYAVVDPSDADAVRALPSPDLLLFAKRSILYRNGSMMPRLDFCCSDVSTPEFTTEEHARDDDTVDLSNDVQVDALWTHAGPGRVFTGGIQNGHLVASLQEYKRRKSGEPNWEYDPTQETTLDHQAWHHNRQPRTDGTRTIDVLLEQGGAGAFILNSGSNHWVLVVIDGASRYLGYFDPLNPGAHGCPEVLRLALTSALALAPGDWTADYGLGIAPGGAVRLQRDSGDNSPYQCGVWALTAEQCWIEFLQEDADSRGAFGPWMHAWLQRNGVGLGGSGSSAFIADQRERYRNILLLRPDYSSSGAAHRAASGTESTDHAGPTDLLDGM